MDLVAYAVPFFILAMLVELVWGLRAGHNTYRINDAVSSLFLGTLSQTRRFVVLGCRRLRLPPGRRVLRVAQLSAAAPGPGFSPWCSTISATTGCTGWVMSGRMLWAAHVAHHQSEDYNLSTALRQTSTGFLLSWIFYLPMFFLGTRQKWWSPSARST
jgi:alkylglycerol monooxygenase